MPPPIKKYHGQKWELASHFCSLASGTDLRDLELASVHSLESPWLMLLCSLSSSEWSLSRIKEIPTEAEDVLVWLTDYFCSASTLNLVPLALR